MGIFRVVIRHIIQSLTHRLPQMQTDVRAQQPNVPSLHLDQQLLLQSTALEAAANAIQITDHDGIIIWVNRAFTELTGYTAEEVVGKHPRMLKSGLQPPEFYRQLWETIVSGNVWHGELINRRKDGSLYHEEMTITPVTVYGIVTHFIAIKQDISERKQTEREVQQAKEAAETANRAKSTFLANMSHELRTPLNAIIGYSEMLEEEAFDQGYDAIVTDLKKIQSAGKHLLALINDILDVSKIEAGKMQFYLETFSLSPMIDEVVETLLPLAEKNGNVVRIDIDSNITTMHADVTKVRQILFNLLSNAAKFTERGTITLQVSYAPAGTHLVMFRVQDTGIGIAPEQQERLFRPFSQADESTTRRYGGTGLGLVISQHFCQMMGGSIEVQSTLGHGSTFTVTLPRIVTTVAGSGWISEEDLKIPSDDISCIQPVPGQRTVLIIDDDPTVHELLRRALDDEGFCVHSMTNGHDGIEAARRLLPDMIILDVMMPMMDGWTVLAILKEDPVLASIPVIMVTFTDDKELGFSLGAVDYLSKPIDRKRLLNSIEYHTGPTHANPHSGFILVVEDDPMTRHMLRRTLEREGWSVVEAEHGTEALYLLQEWENQRSIHLRSGQDHSNPMPDVILLDLMMPETDGFEVIQAVRQHPLWRTIPIIVLTARELSSEERSYLNQSVTQTLQKSPNHREALLGEMRTLVSRVITTNAKVDEYAGEC